MALYKVYVRPILKYELDQNEFDQIKKAEGNIVKSLIGINKQVQTTSLFTALNLELTVERLKKEKLLLFSRLRTNDFTNSILNELLFANEYNSLSNEVCNIIGRDFTTNLVELDKSVDNKIVTIESHQKDLLKYDSKVSQLKEIFKIKNRKIFIQMMHDCIGFVKNTQINAQQLFSLALNS